MLPCTMSVAAQIGLKASEVKEAEKVSKTCCNALHAIHPLASAPECTTTDDRVYTELVLRTPRP